MKHYAVMIWGASLLCTMMVSCQQRERTELPPVAPPAEPLKVAPEQLRMSLVAGEGQAAISDYRGKFLLVNFFGASSPECRAEIAELNALASDLHAKPFALLGIAMDFKPQIYVAGELRESPPAFPYVLGGRAARQAFPTVRALPTKWLLDRDGKVVKRYEGETPMALIRADIDELLK